MSANNASKILGVCSVLLMLGACSDGSLPKWMTGEPTQEEIGAYSGPIAMPPPPAEDEAYPNLADVPPRPEPALTAAERAAEVEELKEENREGQSAVQNFTPPSPRKKK